MNPRTVVRSSRPSRSSGTCAPRRVAALLPLAAAAALAAAIPACGTKEPATVEELATAVAASLCDRCAGAGSASCKDELTSDIVRNAERRAPGGYTPAKGGACLERIEELDCDAMPKNCEENLAIAECDDYLDGQTNGVDPDCNADGTRRAQ